MTSTGLRKLAASLLILTGVSHTALIAIYPPADHVIAATLFGPPYFVLGVLQFWWPRIGVLWVATILPAVGGVLGIGHYFDHPNPFSIFHVVLDVIIVPINITLLIRERKATAQNQI